MLLAVLDSPKERTDSSQRRRWYELPKSRLGLFLVLYCIGFVVCRFDLSKHHALEHPMSNQDAAIWGLVIALVLFLVWRLRGEV